MTADSSAHRHGGGTVDCHRLDLSACDDGDLALLDPAERGRASRFVFERDRIRYIAAHAQARRLLGERLALAPAAVPLTTTANGKPVVDHFAAAMAGAAPGSQALCFNLTHSGAVGYLAIAAFSVGIDVELYRPLEDLQPLIDSYCSPGEIGALAALPVERRGFGFLRIWTRKEAALKAWGTGIGAIPLDEVHVGLAVAEIAPPEMPPGAAQAVRETGPSLGLPATLPETASGPIRYPGLRLTSLAGSREVLSIAAPADLAPAVRIVSLPR